MGNDALAPENSERVERGATSGDTVAHRARNLKSRYWLSIDRILRRAQNAKDDEERELEGGTKPLSAYGGSCDYRALTPPTYLA